MLRLVPRRQGRLQYPAQVSTTLSVAYTTSARSADIRSRVLGVSKSMLPRGCPVPLLTGIRTPPRELYRHAATRTTRMSAHSLPRRKFNRSPREPAR